jgi:hypothetical protein
MESRREARIVGMSLAGVYMVCLLLTAFSLA